MFGSRGDVCHDVRVSQGRVCLAQTHTARRLASGAHGGRAARHSATSPTGRRPVKEDCVRLAPARPQVYAFLRDHAAGRARVGRAARVPVDTHRVRQLLCLRGVWPLRLSGEGGGGFECAPSSSMSLGSGSTSASTRRSGRRARSATPSRSRQGVWLLFHRLFGEGGGSCAPLRHVARGKPNPTQPPVSIEGSAPGRIRR